MSHKTRHAYAASFDEVYAKLTDEAFLRAKYEGIGSRNVNFSECRRDGDVVSIKWTREIPANPPAFARKFLKEWNTLDETMEWTLDNDGSAHADYSCDTRGVPGKLKGDFKLRADGTGCVEDIVMTSTVSIPLVGKKIASVIEDESAKSLADEYEYTKKDLGEA
jgi:hypothetical protein